MESLCLCVSLCASLLCLITVWRRYYQTTEDMEQLTDFSSTAEKQGFITGTLQE